MHLTHIQKLRRVLPLAAITKIVWSIDRSIWPIHQAHASSIFHSHTGVAFTTFLTISKSMRLFFFIFLIRSFWFRIFFCDTQKLSALCWPGIGWCSLSYKMCNIIMIICALKTTIWLWWLVQLLLLLLLMVVLCGTCAMLGWAPLMLSNSDGVEHEPRCRPGPLGWSSIRAVPQYRYRKNYTTAVFVTC